MYEVIQPLIHEKDRTFFTFDEIVILFLFDYPVRKFLKKFIGFENVINNAAFDCILISYH